MKQFAMAAMVLAVAGIPTNAYAAASLWTGPCARAKEVLQTFKIHKTLEANRYSGVRFGNIYTDDQLKRLEADENADVGPRQCMMIELLELAVDNRSNAGVNGAETDEVSLPYVALRMLANPSDAARCKESIEIDSFAAGDKDKLLVANSENPQFKIDQSKYAGKLLIQGEYRFWYESRGVGEDLCSVEMQFVNFEYVWGGHARNFGTAVVVGQNGEDERQADGRFIGQEFSVGLSDGTLLSVPNE